MLYQHEQAELTPEKSHRIHLKAALLEDRDLGLPGYLMLLSDFMNCVPFQPPLVMAAILPASTSSWMALTLNEVKTNQQRKKGFVSFSFRIIHTFSWTCASHLTAFLSFISYISDFCSLKNPSTKWHNIISDCLFKVHLL